MAVPHTDRASDQDKSPNLRIISMGWERAAPFCHLGQHPRHARLLSLWRRAVPISRDITAGGAAAGA